MASGFQGTGGGRKENNAHIIIFGAVAFVAVGYICARGAYYVRENPATPLFIALLDSLLNVSESPFAVAFTADFFKLFGMILVVVLLAVWLINDRKVLNRHYKDGEQCGTAKWQTEKSIKEFNKRFNAPFSKPVADGKENMILSKSCQLSINDKKTGLNANVMVIGGPGSGKSFNIVRPNLLQFFGSYVVTDPSGELMATTARAFEENNYEVRVFNLVDMAHSHRYNPFAYLRGEEDVLTLINCLIKNTESNGKAGGDPFWEKAETALLEAIIFYLIRYQKPERQNFAMVSKLLRQAKADPKTTKSKLDAVFDEVRNYDPNDICLKQYDIFKQASEKTAQSILITAAVRLAPFNIDAVENLTAGNVEENRKKGRGERPVDDMNLGTIGDKPTITYIIVPQGNNPYAFLVNMMYSQMFDTLYYHASMDCEGMRLKSPVRFILDEFANIGLIPDFQVKLTTMRKYYMSCMIFIQAVGQIKNLYKDDWETLIGACDSYVYLGGNELSSMEDLTKKLGDQTIRVRDNSTSHSAKGGSDSVSFKYQKRSLLTIDEIRRLRDGYCIVLIKGQDPFYDKKYKTTEHKNANLLGNTATGERIYNFTYCNTRSESIEKLERKSRLQQEERVKRAEKSRNPAAQPFHSKAPMPDMDQQTPEMEEAKKETMAERVANISFDKTEAVRNGATVREVRNGVLTVVGAQNNYKPVSASGGIGKAILQPNIKSSVDELYDDFGVGVV